MIDRTAVRRGLCRYASDADGIKRLCEDAIGDGMTAEVDWQGSAEEVWGRVLARCDRAAIEALVAEAGERWGAFAEGVPRKWVAAKPGDTVLAVVGVVDELAAALDAIAGRLDRLPGVSAVVVDPSDGVAPAADWWVVVLGARTGGTGVLAEAVEGAGAVLHWRGCDPLAAPADEMAEALGLARRAGVVRFEEPSAAAEAAVDAGWAWVQARRPAAEAEADEADPPVLRGWEAAWLDVQCARWRIGRSPLGAGRVKGRRLERAATYVSLHAFELDAWIDRQGDLILPGDHAMRAYGIPRDSERERAKSWRRRFTKTPMVFLEHVASAPECPALVIEGPPGAGKTVLLQHIAMVLAALHRGETPPAHRIDLDAFDAGPGGAPIPLLIEAKALVGCAEAGDLCDRLADEIARVVGEENIPRRALRAGLKAGRYLLLVDALDEAGTQADRDRVAATLAGWARLTQYKSRLVLTTRPSAWRGSTRFEDPLRVVRTAPMSPDEADELVERWRVAQAFAPGWSDGARAALAEVTRRHGGLDLRGNPLLLVCALIVYGAQDGLPESAARLYQRIVDILCESRASDDAVGQRASLEALFHAMQAEGGAETTMAIEAAAHRLHAALSDRYPTVSAARDGLDRLYEETGLLQFEEAGAARRVRPWHRSFQEYFAAAHLAGRADAVDETTRALITSGRACDPAWEGVMRFLAGVHAERPEQARRHVETLHAAAQGHPRRGRLLGLAATALREYRAAFVGHRLYGTLPNEIVTAFEADGGDWPLLDRLLTLDALGALGDPRLARPMFVEVAGGEFTMGGDDEAYRSVRRRRQRVDDLLFGWRPVCVDDMRHFVDTVDGWRDERWWSEAGGRTEGEAPELWAEQLHHRNRPVVGVSWYAARAFCRWATESGWAAEAWGAPGAVELPSEVEWEYVARGAQCRAYPWGHALPGDGDAARAANGALGLDGPTPIGAFPLGHCGPIVDLAGNVWEWCADKLSADDRVVRGGSWVDSSQHLRVASRSSVHSERRRSRLGFRLMCRIPREPNRALANLGFISGHLRQTLR